MPFVFLGQPWQHHDGIFDAEFFSHPFPLVAVQSIMRTTLVLPRAFRKGVANGRGVYVSSRGVRYEGEFVKGKLEALTPQDCPVTQGPIACGR